MLANPSFHTQLSSIMEMLAKSALSEVCKLVEEDSAELRAELSRLMVANAALTEKLSSLQCELSVRVDAPTLSKSCRSVGVQTGGSGDEAGHVMGPPTIEGVFGKDWCMDMWKDRSPCSLESERQSAQCSDKSLGTFSDQITVTEIKEEDCEEEVANSCTQETLRLNTEEHKECLALDTEGLSIEYSIDDSSCSVSCCSEEDQVGSAVDEDEDEDDDVQFIQESQKDTAMTAAGEPSQNEQQTLPADSEHNTVPARDEHGSFNVFNLQSNSNTNKDQFTCEICSRMFLDKASVTHHMKTHKPNLSQISKQHLPYKNKSKTHMCVPLAPSQRSNNLCKLCGKTFANPSALRVHSVVHTGEKPHRCMLCGKGFTQKGNLKCHLRIHTGERPFHCMKCGRTFTQKVNLNHHLLSHRNREVIQK
ncbi:zinc finger protein 510-like isoform X2 [Myripristis murdjan]|uniref:zinc finger protein 510-like isoform X2 n=1 Tax=Myripristis murdjan TaxID=586833 RepID=UPI00117635C9|nr:zinc finger protein 510-like isoform X2 [Myripristis murdjan]